MRIFHTKNIDILITLNCTKESSISSIIEHLHKFSYFPSYFLLEHLFDRLYFHRNIDKCGKNPYCCCCCYLLHEHCYLLFDFVFAGIGACELVLSLLKSCYGLNKELQNKNMKIQVDKPNSRSYNLWPKKEESRYFLRSQANAMCNPINQLKSKPIFRIKRLRFSDLNDHCILEVFERLSLADLCNVAEVTVRLRNLSQFLFKLKYRNIDTKLLSRNGEKIWMTQARGLFSNFGHLITTLRVSRKDFIFDLPSYDPFKGQQKLLDLIGKYCSPNVLTLCHFWFNPNMIIESLPVFTTLPMLHYHRLSCYCPSENNFRHFGEVLLQIFNRLGLSHRIPQMVQLL